MAYTFGARLDDDSYALTTIDEDQGTASTKGEINGVPFEGGGGGSSDFSTAEVTIINNSGTNTLIYAPVYYSDHDSAAYTIFSDGQNDSVGDIILYKGEAYIGCENKINWNFSSATGDIEIVAEHTYMARVRGNGTITLDHQG